MGTHRCDNLPDRISSPAHLRSLMPAAEPSRQPERGGSANCSGMVQYFRLAISKATQHAASCNAGIESRANTRRCGPGADSRTAAAELGSWNLQEFPDHGEVPFPVPRRNVQRI